MAENHLDLSAFDQHHEALREKETEITSRIGAQPLEALIAPIELELLVPDPHQPRKNFDPASINELARSMQQHGLQEPLLVRPAQGAANRGKYWVTSGERRLRAAQQLGWKSIDCRIRNLDPTQAAVLALALNVHRKDLSEIEKAESLQRLKTLTALTWDKVAELVGVSHGYARQLGSLLNVSDNVKNKVRSGQLPTRTAIALKALPEREQDKWAEKAIAEGLTAEQVREQTQHLERPRITRSTPALEVSPRIENAAAYAPPAPETVAPTKSREGTRTRLLEDSVQAVRNIKAAIARESWAPSAVTPKQIELIHTLYQELSMLHQEMISVRNPFREDPQHIRRITNG